MRGEEYINIIRKVIQILITENVIQEKSDLKIFCMGLDIHRQLCLLSLENQ